MEEMRMRRGGRSESDDMYTRLDGTTLRPLFPFRFVSFCFSFVPVSVDFPPPPPIIVPMSEHLESLRTWQTTSRKLLRER